MSAFHVLPVNDLIEHDGVLRDRRAELPPSRPDLLRRCPRHAQEGPTMNYAAEKALIFEAIVTQFEEYVGIGNGLNDISQDEIEHSASTAADAVIAALDEAREAEKAAHPATPISYVDHTGHEWTTPQHYDLTGLVDL